MAVTLTEQEVRAFVGSNAKYYLKAWRRALSGEGGASGFNLAAFFLVGLWLGYRKMYAAAFILYGIFLIVTVLDLCLFAGMPKMEYSPSGLGRYTGLVAAIVTGVCGNGWYLSHTRRVVAEVRSRGLSEEDHLRTLAARGGTSVGAALGLFLLYLLAVIAVSFAFELVLIIVLGEV